MTNVQATPAPAVAPVVRKYNLDLGYYYVHHRIFIDGVFVDKIIERCRVWKDPDDKHFVNVLRKRQYVEPHGAAMKYDFHIKSLKSYPISELLAEIGKRLDAQSSYIETLKAASKVAK